MQLLARVLPALVVVALTLAAALPWGVPSEARFVLPLVPFAAIHSFAVTRPRTMPPWLTFAAGLATDVLTHGPLGYWSLVYLAGHAMIGILSELTSRGALGRLVLFAISVAAMVVVAWGIASLYFLEIAEIGPLVLAGVIAVGAYPLLALLLGLVERLGPHRVNARLARGG